MFKKLILSPFTAVITLGIVLLLRIWDPNFIESVRLRYFDQLIIGQQGKTVSVHTVDIDEYTLDKFGQWPFPREIYGSIIQDIYERGAGLVVFNVLMPEQDRFQQDLTFSYYLYNYATVLPTVASNKSKNDEPTTSVQVVGQDATGKVVEYPGIIANISALQHLAKGTGVVNTFPEVDGVVRRMPLVVGVNGKLHPALAVETVRVAAQDQRIQIKVGDLGVEAVRVPRLGRIATDELSRIWIDWSNQTINHSASKLPATFDGGIVIVGLSAAGLANPVATAKGEVWPHHLQAAVIGTMLTNSNIQRPNGADLKEILAIGLTSLFLILLMRWTYVGIAATFITIGGAVAGSMYAYANFQILYDSTAFAVGVGLVALHAYMVKFVSEYLQKQQIRKQFATYLSPDLVAKLVKDPSLLHLGGEEKELSIMFTDVRGFTSISEHYGRDVQGLTKIMNRYMTAMTKRILENNGTLDKYIGDAQMAFWNAPLDETLHCKESVTAALEMLGNLKEFNEEISKEGVPAFGMGIGINTGHVVVGNMGSEQRFDYTCLGDAVNLASRLEGQSKNYGVLIVLGPITAERLGSMYFTLELDCIAVKGKKEGVNIYTVFYNPPDDEKSQWEHSKELHNLMLSYYRKQQWDRAIGLVTVLKGEFAGQMDHYYDLWLERITAMQQSNLPPDWDGVFRATSK